MADELIAGEPGLHRVLGLWRVTASGVGIIIGAGIYVLLGAAAETAGGAMWSAFVVAAVLSALTAFSYMELSSMFPRAGGEFEYARQVFPRPVAFAVGWAMVSSLTIASAAVALGFGRYARTFVNVDERVTAAALLAVVVAISIAGIQRATVVVVGLSVVQVLGLVFVVLVGAGHIGDESLTAGGSVRGVVSAAALVFFAFIGFDEVITLSEETVNPTRTIPLALMLALGISTVLYVAVAVVAVSVVGAPQLAASSTPLADVVKVAAGPGAARVMSALAMLTTMNTTLLASTAATRMLYGMSSAHAMPSAFTRLNHRRAPLVAIIIVFACALTLVWVGGVSSIAGAADFGVYITFLSVNIVLVVLRIREPDRRREFRVPGSVRGIPVLPLVATAVTLVMIPLLEVRSMIIGALFLAGGSAVFAVVERRHRPGNAPHSGELR